MDERMRENGQAMTVDTPPVEKHYQAQAGVYDELVDAKGQVRPHWLPWYRAYAGWSAEQRNDQNEQVNRIVRDKGIAYDPFADPGETEQPWFLDLAPLIIAPSEWARLKVALNQRARLFSAIYEDLYGPRNLLTEGYLPPQLIFSDPTFLRPLCDGAASKDGLVFFAVDLVKGTDGNWRVLDNHAETPAGVGFALANRIAATHTQGTLFRQSNGIRLAHYFQRMHSMMVQRSGVEDPIIALLTPGPHHTDYFSHSYLARYLGCLLVEGGDLVVHNNQVRLKTLEGLKPIHVLMRSVEGALSDPLELNPKGFQGVAGMVRAALAGENQIINQLGTAIIENRGIAAFLPQICQHLLGEDLLLHEASRWWLGDPRVTEDVLARLPDLMISDAHEGSGRPGEARQSIDGARLTAEGRKALAEKIQLYGASLVAEAKSTYATTPGWTGAKLEPRPFAVRFYMVRTESGFEVMPGGLSMTISPDSNIGLRSTEGIARDVWITSETQVGPFESLWQSAESAAGGIRTGRALQSRVADNLFWLGCYAERMEGILRLCRQALNRLEEDSGPEEDADTVIEALTMMIEKDTGAPISPFGFGSQSEIERLVRTLLYGKDRANGLQASLAHLQRIAGQTRDRLSSEAWRVLGRFFTDSRWRRDPEFRHSGQVMDFVDTGLMTLAAFSGMVMENMTRNFGWRFLDIGRRIERCQSIAELMLTLVESPEKLVGNSQRLMFLLEVADSFITYRSRYRIMPALPAVIDLLLLDETNPRALAFQLSMLTEHVNLLPREPESGRRSPESLIILDLLSQLQLADMHELAKLDGDDGVEPPLAGVLRQYEEKLPELIDALSRRYFTHTVERPQRI